MQRIQKIVDQISTNTVDDLQHFPQQAHSTHSTQQQQFHSCSCHGNASVKGTYSRQEVQGYGKPLVFTTNNEIPVPKGFEVLIKVSHCGVCHSDIHLQDGYFDLGSSKQQMPQSFLPLVLGHEVGGVVAAFGNDAEAALAHSKTISVGTVVVCHSWIGCGKSTCYYCTSDQEHYCVAGRSVGTGVTPGGFAGYVILPHYRYAIPSRGIPIEMACTYACSGVTAYAAVRKLRPLQLEKGKNNNVLMVGLGGVGHMAFQLFRAIYNGQTPSVADVDEAKLQLAKSLGAPAVINPKDKDALKKAASLQAAAAIDFVGSPQSFDLACASVRRGGLVIVVGLFGGELKMGLPRIPMRALTIQGSYCGNVQDLEDVIDIAAQGKLEKIPIKLLPLTEVNQALDDLRKGKVVGRVVLTV